MSSLIQSVHRLLLDPLGITQSQLQKILDQMLGRQVDYADLYFQSVRHESWVLEEGIVKSGTFSLDKGVGLRAIAGEKTGFAYTDDLQLTRLEEAARAARSIAKTTGVPILHGTHPSKQLNLYPAQDPFSSLHEDEKIEILKTLDTVARQIDPRVQQVMAHLSGVYEMIFLMGSDGTLSADLRPLVRLDVQVIVESKQGREQGYMGGGGRGDYSMFLKEGLATQYAEEAVRQALVNLEAVPAPAGNMPVVLGNGWPGILLHEAIGHGLEGDFNRKGTSAFSHRLGQRVASPACTVVDDGTLPGRRGSLNVDDEGYPTQKTVLIENGILKNYMQDKLNARLMGMSQTGNGRRESYAHLPMPRMTNTYMLPGSYEKEEMIASVERGLYAVNFGGGQVDITSGKFVFSANEAYLIEKGKITKPVKGATLIGNGPEVLMHVSMVGRDLALDAGVGTCGKEGQSVPVGVGQPTLKVDGLIVGGTEH